MSFEVVNGSWNTGSKTPDTEWVSLKEGGVWSKYGSGTFTAPEADNKPAEHYKTGADGTITVRYLPVGKYYWIETRSAAGYKLDSNKQSFTVS